MEITVYVRCRAFDKFALFRRQQATYVICQEIIPIIGICVARMSKARTIIIPRYIALHIEKHKIRTYIYRHLRQIVYLGFLEILRQLSATISENAQLLRIKPGTLYLAETHSAYTRLADAYLNPLAFCQQRPVRIRVNTCHYRQNHHHPNKYPQNAFHLILQYNFSSPSISARIISSFRTTLGACARWI